MRTTRPLLALLALLAFVPSSTATEAEATALVACLDAPSDPLYAAVAVVATSECAEREVGLWDAVGSTSTWAGETSRDLVPEDVQIEEIVALTTQLECMVWRTVLPGSPACEERQ